MRICLLSIICSYGHHNNTWPIINYGCGFVYYLCIIILMSFPESESAMHQPSSGGGGKNLYFGIRSSAKSPQKPKRK